MKIYPFIQDEFLNLETSNHLKKYTAYKKKFKWEIFRCLKITHPVYKFYFSIWNNFKWKFPWHSEGWQQKTHLFIYTFRNVTFSYSEIRIGRSLYFRFGPLFNFSMIKGRAREDIWSLKSKMLGLQKELMYVPYVVEMGLDFSG